MGKQGSSSITQQPSLLAGAVDICTAAVNPFDLLPTDMLLQASLTVPAARRRLRPR